MCKIWMLRFSQRLTASSTLPCIADTISRRLPPYHNGQRGLACLPSDFPMSHKRLQKLRSDAFRRQNCRCFYCMLPMWDDNMQEFCTVYGVKPGKAKFLRCTAEHIEARQNGGVDSISNIAAACFWCNTRRHRGRSKNAPDAHVFKARVVKLIRKRTWHPLINVFTAQ